MVRRGRGGRKKEGREQRRLIIIKDGETARLAGSPGPGSYCKPEHALCFAFITVRIQKKDFFPHPLDLSQMPLAMLFISYWTFMFNV